MALNILQCNEDCKNCVLAYSKKHKLKKGDTFDIVCNGIPKDYVSRATTAQLQSPFDAEILLDPVKWAAEVLDWHCLDPDGSVWERKNPDEYYELMEQFPNRPSKYHRPYQATMLRCLHGDTHVFMADGTVKEIKDIKIGDKVVTYNENRKKTQSSYRVVNKWLNGVKPIYRVELENGDVLKVTSNHPILSWFKDGKENQLFKCKSYKRTYKSLDDGLSIGDKVYTLNQFNIFGSVDNLNLARLLGYIVTDGYVSNSGLIGKKHVVEFRNTRYQYVEEFASLVASVFNTETPKITYHPERVDKDGSIHKEHWSVSVYNRENPLLIFLRDIGCFDKYTREISIANFAFKFSEQALAAFINRVWSGDGCVYVRKETHLEHLRATLTLSSGNEKFLRLFRLLLKKTGVYSSRIYTDIKKLSGTNIVLNINRIEDIERLLSFTGPIYGKEEKSILALEETGKRIHWNRKGNLGTLSRTKIKSIELIGEEPVYDIEVETRHNFIAEGVVVHNCTAKRKIFRIGRQAGKCLPSGTLIQMADGTQKPIELVNDGDLVISMDDNYRSIKTPAFRACNGEKPVARITLMDGRSIEATYNHPFLTRTNVGRETTGKRRAIFHDEWKPIEELTDNDYIAVPRNIKIDRSPKDPENNKDHLMTLLGCLIADGNITDRNCCFSNTNETIIAKLREAVEYYGCELKHYDCDANYDYHIIGSGVGKKHQIKDLLRDFGLKGLDSHEKFIPDSVMSGTDLEIAVLLRAMFGCDGWAAVCADGSVEIGYSTVSEKLATQIVALLARFGVYCTMQAKTATLNGKKFYSRQLTITRKESIANFRNYIGILGKDEAVERVYQLSESKNPSPKTEAYEDNDIVFIKIKSIEHVGTKMTWDLSVPETKNFIANNILTHNTETLIISILYNLFVNDGFKIVLITPYQSQIDLIFKRIEDLIQNNPTLQNSVKRSVKAPQYTIELYNNSQIKGFTAGTKSGGGAGASRGQSAHMLVFDEADYLNSDDMDAAMSIITNFPNATVWMSSTPSGKREKFYDAAHSKDWKEYHFPSSVNPNWNEDLEKLFRNQLTEIGYIHEVEAEFGAQEEGVFQVPYVEAAQQEYNYSEFTGPKSNWIYSIGVDWNSVKNGTTICVTGFNTSNNKFYVVERAVVQRANWTQLEACQRIAELNRKWKPFAIYVDKGFGATQIEVLHKFGYDARRDPERGKSHADSRLPQVVKAYEFGGTIETRDPFTKQKIKKPAKGFLVENAVRRFEARDIYYSKDDKTLTEELLNYIIKNVTQTGQVVYGVNNEAIGDHSLDSLMLSLVAFTLEKSAFGKVQNVEKIEYTEIDSGNSEEFWLPLNIEKIPTRKEERLRIAPTLGRDEVDSSTSYLNGQRLPAANVNPNHSSQPRIVDDGWSRDEPLVKPASKPRSIGRGNVLSRGFLPRRSSF